MNKYLAIVSKHTLRQESDCCGGVLPPISFWFVRSLAYTHGTVCAALEVRAQLLNGWTGVFG